MILRDVKSYICHCSHCLCFKAKQDATDLHPILATTQLELIHMDFLTSKTLKTDKDVNVLVITDHFTCYDKAVVTPNQTAKTTRLAFWNHFIVDYGFPDQLYTDQGQNFENSLIKELCHLAKLKRIKTTPYNPETNDPCERFNYILINIIGALEQLYKSHLKDFLLTLVHMYNCSKNDSTEFSPYYLMFGWKLRLPIDPSFDLATEKSIEQSHNTCI